MELLFSKFTSHWVSALNKKRFFDIVSQNLVKESIFLALHFFSEKSWNEKTVSLIILFWLDYIIGYIQRTDWLLNMLVIWEVFKNGSFNWKLFIDFIIAKELDPLNLERAYLSQTEFAKYDNCDWQSKNNDFLKN